MLKQVLIGSFVIALTVAIQAEMFNLLSSRFELLVQTARRLHARIANTGMIIVAMLYVLCVHTVNVWIWAVVFLFVGAFQSIEPSLYFALVAFTTVGFGDITLGPEWRLLSGFAAANGFLSFGWSTAYMVELMRRTALLNRP